MRVGFFAQGDGEHLHIAKYLIQSVLDVMPGVDVFHLTDEETPEIWRKTLRIGGKIPMAMRRVAHHSMLSGNWLFIDTDCVIRQDVRGVFAEDFSVALTDRVGSIYEHGPYGKVMPYNMGVTFSRSPQFWREVLSRMTALPKEMQEWEGDQLIVGMMARDWPKVKILPGHVYNYSPEKRDDKAAHAAIVHFKGNRKAWIGDLCKPIQTSAA